MSYSENDLDLSKIAPDEHAELASKIEAFYHQDASQKMYLARHWEENHLMLDGIQWLSWVGDNYQATGRLWSPLRTSAENEYIPRPVTNYLFDAYQTLKAYLLQHRPRIKVRPNTQSYTDKQSARLAELVAECNWERLKEEKNYEYAAANVLAYGTVFKKSYWDTSSLQKVRVPMVREQPITDPQTGAIIGYEDKEVVDPTTGDILYEELPLGDLNTDVVEPYRMALDPMASDLHDLRWLMEYNIMPLSMIRELFAGEGEGYTGLAEEVKAETTLNVALRRFYELKNSSGTRDIGLLGGGDGGSEMIKDAAVVKDYYEAPSEKYPNGRRVVVAGGKTLYSGPSPYNGPELGDWHPYSECRWEVVPGRFWGKSPLDYAVDPQKRINSIDSTVILTRKTMAIPQKLVPKGSGIPRGSWGGRPGQQIEFHPVDGAGPSTVPSAGVDGQVWKEREQCVNDIKQITGAIDILKGDRPPGVTAASALEMLYEVGTGKLRPVLDRWKMFIESDQKKQLRIVADKYKEPREEYVKALKSKNSELPESAIENFLGTQLHDNCNVVIEAGSSVPKLEAAHKARIMEAAATGALQLEKPENRSQFLEDMGITGYDFDVGPDVKRAEWENSLLDESNLERQIQPVVLMADNHEVHIEIHNRRLKEPSFLFLPEDVQAAYMQHIQEHQNYIDQAEEMRQLKAMQGIDPGKPADMTQPQGPVTGDGSGAPGNILSATMGADLPPDAKIGG